MSLIDSHSLAPTGSTGNNTHTAVQVPGVGDYAVAFQLVIEAAGATPAITWKIQGSIDGTGYTDIAYITTTSDTAASSAIVESAPAAGDRKIIWLSNPVARRYRYFRLVTSANTNVTYRGELYLA